MNKFNDDPPPSYDSLPSYDYACNNLPVYKPQSFCNDQDSNRCGQIINMSPTRSSSNALVENNTIPTVGSLEKLCKYIIQCCSVYWVNRLLGHFQEKF